MHYNVLIVDDEVMLAEMTAKYFNALGIETLSVATADECQRIIKEHEIDLILLDINLVESSGFDLCQEIRQSYDTPIFFVSARDTTEDMLVALNIGGDDYITKPYDLGILAAKIKARLKRKEVKQDAALVVVTIDNIKIDHIKMKAFLDNKELELKAKEFKLLSYLMTHPNKVIPKDEILYEVWGDTYISDNALNVQISRLREKIEKNPDEPVYIKTIWGQGYMFEVKK
jgi:two-component system response regulator RegX3